MRKITKIGMQYNRLTVIGKAQGKKDSKGGTRPWWKVRCDCGLTLEAAQCELRNGNTNCCKFCTNLKSSGSAHYRFRYGQNEGFGKTVNNIIEKCKPGSGNETYDRDDRRVWKEWIKHPEAFKEYLQKLWEEQTGTSSLAQYGTGGNLLSVDRIDNLVGYFPDNLRFATAREQNLNR